MNDNVVLEIRDLLLQIQENLCDLRKGQSAMEERLSSFDQRLVQVERCVTNHYNDFRQTGSRDIWSDEQRATFSEWLFSNTLVEETPPENLGNESEDK